MNIAVWFNSAHMNDYGLQNHSSNHMTPENNDPFRFGSFVNQDIVCDPSWTDMCRNS